MALAKKMMGGGVSAGMAKSICGDYGAVTAAGSTQTDAATVNVSNSVVASADGTKGVILPAVASPGESVTIFNNSASTLKVYPPTSAAIAVPGTGLGTVNAAYSHTTYATVTYTCFSATQWVCNKSA